MARRFDPRFALVSLFIAAGIGFGLVGAPNFTDAYYHFNAAQRWASGQGMTDAYVWTYIGAADSLPMSSHLYWMPMTSTVSAAGIALFSGAIGDWRAAQVPIVLLTWGAALIAWAHGARLGGTTRHAWAAGLLTLFSPFFIRFWGTTDTFAPYAFFGAAALWAIGAAAERAGAWRWLLAGALAGAGHLTRADGLLLLGVAGLFALLTPGAFMRRVRYGVLVTLGYVGVMLPFFVRNLSTIGAPLPLGGASAVWFTGYNDLFNYPPEASPAIALGEGLSGWLAGRADAIGVTLATVIAVEGMLVLLPFMLYGGWLRRGDRALHPFWLYALLMHIAMTLVFPYPGARGGLFHSAAALIPVLSALAIVGIDGAVAAVARRRRGWRALTAQRFFTFSAVVVIGAVGLWIGWRGRAVERDVPPLFAALSEALPGGARVLFDDPPALYYYTARLAPDGVGMGGATLPNTGLAGLQRSARQYAIDYLLLKNDPSAVPPGLLFHDEIPDFLVPIPFASEEARLYVFRFDDE
jgi:hypothetical protein